MRTLAISLAVIAIVVGSYSAGWQTGRESVPAYDEAREAEARAFWAALDEELSEREILCQGLFEDVQEILNGESLERDARY